MIDVQLGILLRKNGHTNKRIDVMSTPNTAYKLACLDYAKKFGLEIPPGFLAHTDFYGSGAQELTKRIQEHSKVKADGAVIPETFRLLEARVKQTEVCKDTKDDAVGSVTAGTISLLKHAIIVVALFDCLVATLVIALMLVSLISTPELLLTVV